MGNIVSVGATDLRFIVELNLKNVESSNMHRVKPYSPSLHEVAEDVDLAPATLALSVKHAGNDNCNYWPKNNSDKSSDCIPVASFHRRPQKPTFLINLAFSGPIGVFTL